jgi:dTDP-4-amino-4,6-dideoxygalactose transaminase
MRKQPQHIPFNRPFIVGHELDYISEAVSDGWLAGDGKFTKKCQKWMEEHYNAKKVLLTHSCTAALEMSAILAGVSAGSEVIMPSFTFVSTANAFVLCGAKIRFIDIREDTLNMDEALLEKAIGKNTAAIVPVHYAGVGCEMDKIMQIAESAGVTVIEDAAQGIGAKYGDSYLGTIGQMGAYSFHETKNFISGEGGALIINDEKYIERAEIIREKGTDRARFFRGETDKYTWQDIGSSYLPSELVAAFLYAQLEHADRITKRRMDIYQYYMKALKPLAADGLLRLPCLPPQTAHNAHMFYLICRSEKERDQLKDYLAQKGIHAVFHYVPLHKSPMGLKHSVLTESLEVTERMSSRLLRLPCFYELQQSQQDEVAQAVYRFFGYDYTPSI